MAKSRLLLLDVIDSEGFKEIECDGLQDYYDALKCDCFDIANRRIGDEDRRFDIFVDDCGLFVDSPIVSAIDSNLKPALVGNLIFAHHDAEGNTTGLSDDDIEYIKMNSIGIVDFDAEPMRSWIAVGKVDY